MRSLLQTSARITLAILTLAACVASPAAKPVAVPPTDTAAAQPSTAATITPMLLPTLTSTRSPTATATGTLTPTTTPTHVPTATPRAMPDLEAVIDADGMNLRKYATTQDNEPVGLTGLRQVFRIEYMTTDPSGLDWYYGHILDGPHDVWVANVSGGVLSRFDRGAVPTMDYDALEKPPTPTPVPLIVEAYSPNDDSPLEDMVILRGEQHLFDPSAVVSGGAGLITACWDIDADGVPESTDIDPAPFSLPAGVYDQGYVEFSDGVNTARIELPRVVRVGEPRQPRWKYGVMAHLNRNHALYENYEEVERAIMEVSDLGLSAVRMDFHWPVIEQRQGRFDWADYDEILDLLAKYGLTVLPLVNGSPEWASSEKRAENWDEWFFAAPADPLDFGMFVYRLASRYTKEIECLEIWNEPNQEFFLRGTDPFTYVQMLKAAYVGAKYGNPEVVVVLGGLAKGGGPEDRDSEVFLEEVYRSGGAPYFDAVAIHPYSDPRGGLADASEHLLGLISETRTVMVENGDQDKLLWVTETGWSSYSDVSEDLQAEWLLHSFEQMARLDYLGPIFWYNLRDKGIDPEDFEDNMGLLTRAWRRKEAWSQMQSFTQAH